MADYLLSYQVNASRQLSPYLNFNDWADLPLSDLARLCVLINPRTTCHQIGRQFNFKIVDLNQARQMLSTQPLPEINAAKLTTDELEIVNRIVSRELTASQYGLENDLDYADAYQQLFPYLPVYVSSIVLLCDKQAWLPIKRIDLINKLATNSSIKNEAELRERFAIEIKLHLSSNV
jgi:hypothetical protein